MDSLKENAYGLIKKRILNSSYQSNDVIDEKLIATELNSSRTPVREAIIALSQEGYVNIIPKRGVFVAPFTYKDALDIWQIRELIEPWLIEQFGCSFSDEELDAVSAEVIKEACQDINTNKQPSITFRHQPHEMLLNKCDNQNILKMLTFVEEQSKRIPNAARVIDPPQHISPELEKQYMDDHLLLVSLLKEKKIAQAMEWAKEHVSNGKKRYMSFWFE